MAFNADAIVLRRANLRARLTLAPSKMRHAVMPIKWGLLEFPTRQTRIKPALPRVGAAWRQQYYNAGAVLFRHARRDGEEARLKARAFPER